MPHPFFLKEKLEAVGIRLHKSKQIFVFRAASCLVTISVSPYRKPVPVGLFPDRNSQLSAGPHRRDMQPSLILLFLFGRQGQFGFWPLPYLGRRPAFACMRGWCRHLGLASRMLGVRSGIAGEPRCPSSLFDPSPFAQVQLFLGNSFPVLDHRARTDAPLGILIPRPT